MHRVVFTLALVVFALGCKPDPKPTTEEPTEKPDEKETPKEAPATDAPKAPKSSAIPGTQNQLLVDQKIPEVKFTLTSPKDGETLPSGEKVEVKFAVENYRTGREIGQHVHIIMDNEPYKAHYEGNEAYVFKNVKPGTHTIRAFPARHYHLSLKEGDVFETVTFHVEKKSETSFDPKKPYITYSRPKGTYDVEAAKNLLLDFYVQNIELGKDAKVVYGVNGKETELTTWAPVLLEPLAAGEHEITLKLVGANGKVIENGGFNNTTRKITVK